MKIILETERLYLREFIASDGFHFYHLNNDFEVLRYTGNQPFKSLEEAMIFIKNYSDYKRNGYGRWAVCIKETHEFIGWCGLKFEEKKEETDLGYRFYKKHWGKGYATEAAKACVNYGFSVLKLKKLIGRVSIKNIASIEVLKKCGFIYKNKFIYNHQPAVLYGMKYDRN
ncbi:GNAT family N-acetyltransferase [Lutibacter sp.]|uniref:GNAT family N-acetyltransferase n=1 Tax=Lutibacter sp. TaxID=1925666 RepID=UPI003564969C